MSTTADVTRLRADLRASRKDVKRLEKERDRWQGEGACDVCTGKGKAQLGGSSCLCGGSGLAVDALINLRKVLFEIEQERNRYKETLERIAHYGKCNDIDVAAMARTAVGKKK